VLEAGASLDLISSCLNKLSQAFKNVESQFVREQGLKSTAMLTQLSDAVSILNHSCRFLKVSSKFFSAKIIHRVSVRNLRLREHSKLLS
jgi:hypothetical protein